MPKYRVKDTPMLYGKPGCEKHGECVMVQPGEEIEMPEAQAIGNANLEPVSGPSKPEKK